MSEPIPPESVQTFTDGKISFHVVMTEAGALKISLIGRGNGRMLIQPECNTSATLHSEKQLGTRRDNR